MELHDEILGELHRVVPNSEYTQLEVPRQFIKPTKRPHHRWRSLDSVHEDIEHTPWLERIPGMVADPQVAEEVAKIFGKRVRTDQICSRRATEITDDVPDESVLHI